MKFLVLWRIELTRLTADVVKAVFRMPEYAEPLERDGKVLSRYHVVGAHGGAWIYEVDSNEELEMLLARSPVYNFAHFDVYPLAEMAAKPVADPGRPER
jgi:muconolactone delta-isomerase